MMKTNKLLILASAFLLIGCAKKDPYAPTTKKINNEQALAINKEILKHQQDSKFIFPNKWSISFKEKGREDNKMEGEEESFTFAESFIESLDLDNLMYALDSTSNDSGKIAKEAEYQFWKNGIYYTLKDENGQKWRTEEKNIEKSEAKEKLLEKYSDEIKGNIAGSNRLEDFPETEMMDLEYKKEAEQSPYFNYNYQYGSDNNKSFERVINSKFNRSNFEEEGEQYKNRTQNNKERELWDNDLRKTYISYTYGKEEFTNGDYSLEEFEEQYNFSYNDKVKIKLPNINDYPLKK